MTLTPHPRFVSILYAFLFYSFCAFIYFLLYSLHLAVRYYIFFVTFSPQHNRRPPPSLDVSGLLHSLKIKRLLKLMHKTAIFFVFFIFFSFFCYTHCATSRRSTPCPPHITHLNITHRITQQTTHAHPKTVFSSFFLLSSFSLSSFLCVHFLNFHHSYRSF